MKKNITIICMDHELGKSIGKLIAKKYQMDYLDIDDLINYEVQMGQDVALKSSEEYLQKLERKCIERALDHENCVFTLKADLFIANDNNVLFEDIKVVLLETSKESIDVNKISDKHEKLNTKQYLEIFDNIKNYLLSTCTNIIYDADNKTQDEIVNEIDLLLKI